jgi:outer membrane protein TolC
MGGNAHCRPEEGIYMTKGLGLRFALIFILFAPKELSPQERSSDLPMLLVEAAASNPRIHAADRAVEAARARVPQAGALPDPMLGLGFMNFPIADPSFGREVMTMTRLQIQGSFPWPGKRGLAEDTAYLLAEAAGWEAERVRVEVFAEVKAAYFEVYFVDRALEITSRNERLVADFASLTSAGYSVGRGSQTAILRAQVERTRLADQTVSLQERRTSVVAELNALLGRTSDTPIPSAILPEEVRLAADVRGESTRFVSAALSEAMEGLPSDPIPSAAELQRLALDRNPMIRAHLHRVGAQERSVELARKAVLPDLHLSVGYSYRPNFGDFLDLMVSAPLPIFSGRKQDQAVVAEAAALAEDRAMHHTMVLELNAEIVSLLAKLRRTRQQIHLLSDGILPQAGASLQAATASYRVGAMDFLALLDAQVTLYRIELDYHRLLADFAGDIARLERAVGGEVLR